MKSIPLTQGKFALVDDEDFERTIQYNWTLFKRRNLKYTEYAKRHVSCNRKNGKRIIVSELLHRFILCCEKGDGKIIDHKDGNGLNNQKSNLRFCTSSQNNSNKKAHGKSEYLGVSFDKKSKKWRMKLTKNYKAIIIKFFIHEKDAAKAYNQEAIKYHGQFAKLNDV